MKFATLLGAIALASTAIGEDTGIYRLDFNVLRGNSKRDLSLIDERPSVVKRDGSAELEIQNQKTFYMADLKVGSNKDEVQVLVDTGSSDLWMMSHDLTCEAESSSSSKRDVIVGPFKGKHDETEGKKKIGSKTQGHVKHVSRSISDASTASADVNVKDFWGFSEFTTVTIGPGGGGGSGGGSGGSVQTGSASGQTTNTCTSYGSFLTSGSDTFHRNNSADSFSISYADGTDAYGIWGTDDVSFGNITVKNLSFAVVNETSSNVGVLGIGLPGLETTYSSSSVEDPYQYENLPLKLKTEGIIKKTAYSVYLGEADAKSGTVLFGAVDSAKYSGELQTVQIVNTLESSGYTEPIQLRIIVNGLKFNDSGNEIDITSNEYTAILDTGSTYSYFPTSLLKKVGETLGGTYSSSLGAYIVDCVDDDSYYFTINFSGANIKVPLPNLITKYEKNKCFLSVLQQSNADYILFGDNVLRSAYLVYDLEDYEISLAQVKYTSDEDISVISSSVPNAVKASGYSSTALPSSAQEQGAAETATFSGSSGSKSSIASMNRVSFSKVYTLLAGTCLIVALCL